MIKNLTISVAKYLIAKNAAKEKDRELIEFGLFYIFSDILQFVVLMVIALLLSIQLEIIAFVLCFTTLKGCIGGAHANENWICLCIFTSMATFSSLASIIIPPDISRYIAAACNLVMLVLVLWKAPIPHYNKPVSRKKFNKMRKYSVLTVLIQFTCIFICNLFFSSFAGSVLLSMSLGGFLASVTLMITNRKEDVP